MEDVIMPILVAAVGGIVVGFSLGAIVTFAFVTIRNTDDREELQNVVDFLHNREISDRRESYCGSLYEQHPKGF